MPRPSISMLLFVVLLAVPPASPAQVKTQRQALAPLGDLIGTWKGTGIPSGSRDDKSKAFWIETIACEWQFKGEDAWLKLSFEKGKYFSVGELRYLPDSELYRVTLQTLTKESWTFTGPLKEKVLTLARTADGEEQKLVITVLHENRFLYRFESRPQGKGLFARKYQVGATKEGIPFAAGDGRPECVVSGGLGTTPVSYMGKTYYVCCSGCRDEFRDNPKKYVDEFEAKKGNKSK